MILCISTSDWIQIFIGGITAIGIFTAIMANRKQLKIFNQQLKLNFFTDYTKRYQEICLHFPENINETDFSFDLLGKEKKETTLRYMRAYFDLCSEEYHLNDRGFIDQEVWKLWEGGIKYAFSKKAFKDGWAIIKADTKYHPIFYNWVISEVEKSPE